MPYTPVRSKQMELFEKLHLSMDHVLAKLLLEAPPLPNAMKLQTETQSLATTWGQVTEAFEKRKAMLQRRKEKSQSKNKRQKRDLTTQPKEKSKENEKSTTPRQKKESRRAIASPRNEKRTLSVKAINNTLKKQPDRQRIEIDLTEEKGEEEPSVYDQNVLKKLRTLSMCHDVKLNSNKYRALVKWMELDKGKNAGMSADLKKLLTMYQLDVTPHSTRAVGKHTRKRSLGSLDDNHSKLESLQSTQRQMQRVRDTVSKEGKEKDLEGKGKESDSNGVDFERQQDTSRLPVKNTKRGRDEALKKQTQQVGIKMKGNASSGASQLTAKDHLVAGVANIRSDKGISETTDAKNLSYATKEGQPNAPSTSMATKPATVSNATPGTSPTSAIILDDSDEEDEEEAKKLDSSTDDDHDLFDLNEEDVYVVEAILCVKEGRSLMVAGRRQKEVDLYLVKWEGYNELTWEPDENIPRRLVEIFQERERAKRACQYQIKVAHERREVMNVTTQQPDVIYALQWINQELPTWESRTTLPLKTQIWLDKVLGAPTIKKR